MKLKFYFFFFYLFSAGALFGQNTITYSDNYQLTPVTLTKDAALTNGKISYTGTGTIDNVTYTYRIRWCSNYHDLNFGAWILGADEDDNTGCTIGNAYFFSRRDIGAPPGRDTGGWELPGTNIAYLPNTGLLFLSGPGVYGKATLTSAAPSVTGSITTTLGGNVTIEGGSTVEKGIVYSTSSIPTSAVPGVGNTKVAIGSGEGAFSQNVSGFAAGTFYYARAYATNASGTAFGTENTFTTRTPTITASNVTGDMNTTFGSASGNGSFTVSGTDMAAGVTVNVPSGFEVSTNSGSNFGGSIVVGSVGTISSTTVYVRLTAGTAAGSYSGNISLTSTSAPTKNSVISSNSVGRYNLTITAANVPKTYGTALSSGAGSIAYSITSGTLQNANTITSLTITHGTGAAATDAVGTYATAVPSAVVGANGFTVNNYNITYLNGSIVVGTKALTITANAANKSYGAVLNGGTGSTAFSQSGLQNSETIGSVTVAYSVGAGNGNTATDAAGPYVNKVTISAATGGTFTATNYNISYVQGNIVVSPKALTITASNVDKPYGTTLPGGSGFTAFSQNGLQNGESIGTVTISYTAGSGNGNTGTDIIGTYVNKITASAATGGTFAAGNYTISYVQGNVVVIPAVLTYTASVSSRIYGSENPTFTGSVTGFVNSENEGSATTGTLNFSSLATSASNVNSYLISGTGLTANNGNYTFSQAAGNATALTVTPALLTYVANAASRDYGVANPVFSGTVTGFVLSQMQAGAITGTLVFSSPATASSNVGSYPVDGSGLVANNGNYIFAQAEANATALTIACATGRLYVKAGGTGNGQSWLSASGDLQKMISQACGQTEIWVAGGIYTPQTLPTGVQEGLLDRRNAFSLKKDVKLYGGFAGTETTLAERNLNLTANASILSGDLDKNDNGFTGNELNAGHVVISAGDVGTAVLDGFTIKGGNNTGASDITVNGQVINYFGAGISCKASSPTLTNLIITENDGIYGAGVGFYTSSAILTDSHIYNNRSQYGGAIGISSAFPTLTNLLINGNTATTKAGALFIEFGSIPVLTHVTITANTTTGAGNIFNDGGTLRIRNSIIYGNDKGFSLENSSVLDIKNSLVQGNTDLGNGNISGDTNPDFISLLPAGLGATGDYHLSICSPVINAGGNSYANGIDKDLDKNPRSSGSAVDMGAYEFVSNPDGPDALANATEEASLMIVTNQKNVLTVDNAACRIVAAITPDNTATSVTGSISAKVWVEGTQPGQYVKRHYEITPSVNAGTATGKVTLYFSDDEFSAFNTQNPAPSALLPLSTDNNASKASGISNIRIEKKDGVSSDGTGLPVTYSGAITTIDPDDADVVWNSTASRWEISFSVTGFSGFFVKTQSVPLPVRWVTVEAALNVEKKAVINWKVVETNVATYAVEKSSDSRSFASLVSIEAKGDGMQQYTITDGEVLSGTAYFRIRQTDLDGTTTFSRILSLSSKSDGEKLIVYPLPAHNEVIVDVKTRTDPEYRVSVMDLTGRILHTQKLETGINKVNIIDLKSGIYLLRTSRGELYKMVKE